MIRSLFLLILSVTIVQFSFAQNFVPTLEDSIGVKTDIKAYYKVLQLREIIVSKDSIISLQDIQMSACDKFSDSLKFELNTSIRLGQNLSKNCKSEIAKIKKGQAIKSAALYVLIPILLYETAIILVR